MPAEKGPSRAEICGVTKYIANMEYHVQHLSYYN